MLEFSQARDCALPVATRLVFLPSVNDSACNKAKSEDDADYDEPIGVKEIEHIFDLHVII